MLSYNPVHIKYKNIGFSSNLWATSGTFQSKYFDYIVIIWRGLGVDGWLEQQQQQQQHRREW